MPIATSHKKSLQYGVATATLLAFTQAVNAQCVDPGAAKGYKSSNYVPFGSGTAISSIVSTIGTINTSSLAQSSALTGAPGEPAPGQMGAGVWVREVGGTVRTKANSSTVGTDADDRTNATTTCNVSTKTDFVGTQIGFDIARLNVMGSNIFLGVTAGQFSVNSKDRTAGESTFSSEFDVPFAGVYMALNRGPLTLNSQLRWDGYRGKAFDSNTVQTELNQALYGQKVDANAVTWLMNAAYRFDVPNSKWFVEPSIGGVWSRTQVDAFNTTGNYAIYGFGTGGDVPPGTAKIDTIESLLGRASLRVGTTIIDGNVAWQPFATGSIFHEFGGDVKASMVGPYSAVFPTSPFGQVHTGEASVSRLGTYGHVGLGLSGVLLNSGWLGYVRGDYRFGDNIEGISVNAGLRYQFSPVASTAGLKDSPVESDRAAVYAWTGPYIGALGGAAFAPTTWSQPDGKAEPRSVGGLIGGQAGYNFQVGSLVFGPELEWGWANTDGNKGCPGNGVTASGAFGGQVPSYFYLNCHTKIEQLALITGRVGYAWDRALLYLKGGVAIGDVRDEVKYNLQGVNTAVVVAPLNLIGGQSNTMVGWTLGTGIEFAITDRVTAKGEYMHFDLGSDKFSIGSAGTAVSSKVSGETVRIGVNYQIGH